MKKLSKKGSKYTPEIVCFLKKHIKGRHIKELTEMVNSYFGTSFSKSQIVTAAANYGLKSSRKIDNQDRHKPIGTEKIKAGCTMIKVSNEGVPAERWRMKHQLVWEQANGKVPKGYVILFLDGNKQNASIENLAMVSKQVHCQMAGLNLYSANPEATRTGIVIAQMSLITHKRLKEHLGGQKEYAKYRTREHNRKKGRGQAHVRYQNP